MNEFLLIFRRDYKTGEMQLSHEVMQVHLTNWQEWFDSLAARNLLAWPIRQLDAQGTVIGPGEGEFAGPYYEMKETIGGLVIIKATDYEAAVNVAKDCPILELGGTVEIRQGN